MYYNVPHEDYNCSPALLAAVTLLKTLTVGKRRTIICYYLTITHVGVLMKRGSKRTDRSWVSTCSGCLLAASETSLRHNVSIFPDIVRSRVLYEAISDIVGSLIWGSRGSATHKAIKAGSRYVRLTERAAMAQIGRQHNVMSCSYVSDTVIYGILHLWTKQTR